jgi:hypothetical protein
VACVGRDSRLRGKDGRAFGCVGAGVLEGGAKRVHRRRRRGDKDSAAVMGGRRGKDVGGWGRCSRSRRGGRRRRPGCPWRGPRRTRRRPPARRRGSGGWGRRDGRRGSRDRGGEGRGGETRPGAGEVGDGWRWEGAAAGCSGRWEENPKPNPLIPCRRKP